MSLSLKNGFAENYFTIISGFCFAALAAILIEYSSTTIASPYGYIGFGLTVAFIFFIFFGINSFERFTKSKNNFAKNIFIVGFVSFISLLLFLAHIEQEEYSKLIQEKGISKQVEVKVYEGASYIKNENNKYILIEKGEK